MIIFITYMPSDMNWESDETRDSPVDAADTNVYQGLSAVVWINEVKIHSFLHGRALLNVYENTRRRRRWALPDTLLDGVGTGSSTVVAELHFCSLRAR